MPTGYKIRKLVWDCDCRPAWYDYDNKIYSKRSEAEKVQKSDPGFLEIFKVEVKDMKGYKIRYESVHFGHRLTEYDNVVYMNIQEAEKVMEDAQEQFPECKWEIYEVMIKQSIED